MFKTIAATGLAASLAFGAAGGAGIASASSGSSDLNLDTKLNVMAENHQKFSKYEFSNWAKQNGWTMGDLEKWADENNMSEKEMQYWFKQSGFSSEDSSKFDFDLGAGLSLNSILNSDYGDRSSESSTNADLGVALHAMSEIHHKFSESEFSSWAKENGWTMGDLENYAKENNMSERDMQNWFQQKGFSSESSSKLDLGLDANLSLSSIFNNDHEHGGYNHNNDGLLGGLLGGIL
ncbi:hypothetical protein LRR81_09190 [Metabacillus sp. GX 13764]|uniref:hypothetical protein n=1 Tax=Metabacillus kandeliae TaxID=2900151 RepID=UPI001E3FF26A|nr:hypothetical protein [Metabacillus kandeliae]MCD7034410.1 hypothetical protein [Metabacillus kandeliae]